MIKLYGTRLVGKVDRVSDVLYVSTMFRHVCFLPLYPQQSYVVFKGTESRDGSFRGIKIGFNLKSILAAYLRTGLILGGPVLIALGLLSLIVVRGQMPVDDVVLFAGLSASGVGCLILYGLSHLWAQAGSKRAQALVWMARGVSLDDAQDAGEAPGPTYGEQEGPLPEGPASAGRSVPGSKRSYFGMTAAQAGVVAALAVVAVVLFALGGVIVFTRSQPSAPAAALPASQTPSPQVAPSPVPTSTPIPTPALEPGWVFHESPEGFVIALPDTWVLMDLDAATIDAALAPIRQYYPDIEFPFLEGELTVENVRAQGIRLFAVDTEPGVERMQFVGSMNVICQPAGTVAEVDVQGLLKGYEDRGFAPVHHRRVGLPIGDAEEFRFTAEGGPGGSMTSLQYWFVGGGKIYVVSMSSAPEVFEAYVPVFETMIRSLRLGWKPSTSAPVPTPEPLSPSCMPAAAFVADVSVPDGTEFAPGGSFSKAWRVRSSGCAPWPARTRLVFDSGDRIGGPDGVEVPETPLGDTADVAVQLTAPGEPGTYRGYWQMEAPDGTRFGDMLYVMIVVR